MLTLAPARRPDTSMSAASARVGLVSPTAGGNERSDPRLEWALRFDQGLKRAAERIRAWARDPEGLADDGLVAPTHEAIARAFDYITQWEERVMDRVVPDAALLLHFWGASLGSGGEISFDFGFGPYEAITYRVEPDGAVTKLVFFKNELQRREQIAR